MARGRQGTRESKRRASQAAVVAPPSKALAMPVDPPPLDPLEVSGMTPPKESTGLPVWQAALNALQDVEEAVEHARRGVGPGATYRAGLQRLGEAVLAAGYPDAPPAVKTLLRETEQLRLSAGAAKSAPLSLEKQDASGAQTQVFTDKLP